MEEDKEEEEEEEEGGVDSSIISDIAPSAEAGRSIASSTLPSSIDSSSGRDLERLRDVCMSEDDVGPPPPTIVPSPQGENEDSLLEKETTPLSGDRPELLLLSPPGYAVCCCEVEEGVVTQVVEG